MTYTRLLLGRTLIRLRRRLTITTWLPSVPRMHATVQCLSMSTYQTVKQQRQSLQTLVQALHCCMAHTAHSQHLAAISSSNWRHIHDLVSAKGKTKELYCCDSSFDRSILIFLMREGLQCRIISILKHCLMTDEAMKRYQSADFCFPICRNYVN